MANRSRRFYLLTLVLAGLALHAAPPPVQPEATKPGLEDRQDALLGELAACESGNVPIPIAAATSAATSSQPPP
jgi:hypothetical protein